MDNSETPEYRREKVKNSSPKKIPTCLEKIIIKKARITKIIVFLGYFFTSSNFFF